MNARIETLVSAINDRQNDAKSAQQIAAAILPDARPSEILQAAQLAKQRRRDRAIAEVGGKQRFEEMAAMCQAIMMAVLADGDDARGEAAWLKVMTAIFPGVTNDQVCEARRVPLKRGGR